jgi:hypothetical protein
MSLSALEAQAVRLEARKGPDSLALKHLKEQIRLEKRRQNQNAKEVWMSGPNINEGPQEE